MKTKIRAKELSILIVCSTLAFCLLSWLACPFLVPPDIHWGHDIGREERSRIMSTMNDLYSGWSQPIALTRKSLLRRMSNSMADAKSVTVEKVGDGYSVIIVDRFDGVEEESMRFVLGSDFELSSVRKKFD